jgi:hypothetical protein
METEQTIVDHDETSTAYRLAVAAYERENLRPNPDPARLLQLFERMAELQTQLGELEAEL